MWTVETVDSTWRDDVSVAEIGHVFTVRIVMKHRPDGLESELGESPRLVWKEWITMMLDDRLNDTRKYWEWDGDLYAQRPRAHTFDAWRRRYLEAYNTAAMQPTYRDMLRGAVELCDANGGPLRIGPDLNGSLPSSDEDKAVFIRRWMAQNECTLTVEIDDHPMVSNGPTREGKRCERLLLFECGAGPLVNTASQHVVIDRRPAGTPGVLGLTHQFSRGWQPQFLDTAGFQRDWVSNHSLIYEFRNLEETNPSGGEYQ